MNVEELIERLRDLDPHAEVRLATQPSWPLQFHIQGVATAPDTPEHDDGSATDGGVVYIVEGEPVSQTPYAPDWVFAAAS